MSSDDLTKQTPTADRLDELISLVHRIAADVADMKPRLSNLQKKVDERLHDTRPIWEALKNQITELRNEVASNFRKFDRKLDVLHGDIIDTKDKQRELESRVDKLE